MFDRIGLCGLLLTAACGTSVAEDAVRDPFRPPGYGATQGAERAEPRFDASAWRLASTLVARDRKVAIINGRAVGIGDRVGGAEVLAIRSGRVRLDYRGREFSIRRGNPRVRYQERRAGGAE